jgi:hypothetical protein
MVVASSFVSFTVTSPGERARELEGLVQQAAQEGGALPAVQRQIFHRVLHMG